MTNMMDPALLEAAVHAYAAGMGRSPMAILLAVRNHTLRFDGANIVDPAAMRATSAAVLFPSTTHDALEVAVGRAVLAGTLVVCFHCGQMFSSRALCLAHFGASERDVAACQRQSGD